jgi:phage tail sheath protein FI
MAERRAARRQTRKAYFVRCDRSTMTQNDLDNGRLVVPDGRRAAAPAEFVIFRIGQWTADVSTRLKEA